MTIKELIETLQKYPGNMEVFIQKDEEGNGYYHTDDIHFLTKADGTRPIAIIVPTGYELEDPYEDEE